MPPSPEEWNRLVASLPGAHVLQSWEWGKFKAQYGWQPLPRVWRDAHGSVVAAALVLKRSLRIGGTAFHLSVMYVPKGPLCDWNDPGLRQRVLTDLVDMAVNEKAIFIKIDPDLRLGTGVPGEADEHKNQAGHEVVAELKAKGWRFLQRIG